MQFSIYRDYSSISFVRCTSPILGTALHAEGSAFSIATALARCESEVVEREFQISALKGLAICGIAAHPNRARAVSACLREAIETTCLNSIRETGRLDGLKIRLPWIGIAYFQKVSIAGENFTFCLFDGQKDGQQLLTHSVRSTMLSAFLKAWAEFRTPYFYRLRGDKIRNFSKGNDIPADRIQYSFRLSNKRVNPLPEPKVTKLESHYVAYITTGDP